MIFKDKDSNQAVLKQLWGRNAPPLASEQIDSSIKLRQKIKERLQREHKFIE